LLPAHNMHGFELAALDSLQHGLSRDPERTHSLAHRQKVVGRFAVEAGLEFIGQTNAPGSARRELLAGDYAVVSKRWIVEGATPSATAACLMVKRSPAACGFSWKLEIFQCRRKLPTRLRSKRWP